MGLSLVRHGVRAARVRSSSLSILPRVEQRGAWLQNSVCDERLDQRPYVPPAGPGPAGHVERRHPRQGRPRRQEPATGPGGVDRLVLARALAIDTVTAAAEAVGPHHVVVVTSDAEVLEAVAPVGVGRADDPGRGLNEAVHAALGDLPSDQPAAVLLGDVPALRPPDLRAALVAGDACDRWFVPDAEGTGTVLLGARTAATVRPAFGSGSAGRHESGGQHSSRARPRTPASGRRRRSLSRRGATAWVSVRTPPHCSLISSGSEHQRTAPAGLGHNRSMPEAPDLTGQMMGHGVYGRHSLAQHSAGGFGLPGLERAARSAAAVHGAEPVVIADLGAAGGRNELQPMTVAIETLRDAGVTAPITVVHTDIPPNDFSALFETVEHDPDTYLRLADVYTLAAGRSFYGRIFPPESLTLGVVRDRGALDLAHTHADPRTRLQPVRHRRGARRLPGAVGRRLAGLPRVAGRGAPARCRDGRRRRGQPGRRPQRRRGADERARRGAPRGGRLGRADAGRVRPHVDPGVEPDAR